MFRWLLILRWLLKFIKTLWMLIKLYMAHSVASLSLLDYLVFAPVVHSLGKSW